MSTKMVIVVRKDLKNIEGQKIRTGKIIAQAGHAVLGVVESQGAFAADLNNIDWENKECTEKDNYLIIPLTPASKEWFTQGSGFTKVCVGCNSEEELDIIYNKAIEAGLPVQIITDSGRTEFGGISTKTCLAIGPEESGKIDKITGYLSLL